ncbi:MAG: TMEM14 family protein [Blastocatellia bacterium]
MIAWLVLIYGILVAAGGVMGYVKASSMPSLIAGGISGIALVGSAVAMMKGAYSAGWWISLIVALLLLGKFGSQALSGGFKMMPGGMVIILSVIVIAALLTHRAQ